MAVLSFFFSEGEVVDGLDDFSAATMFRGFRCRTCRLLRTPQYFEDTPQLTITDDPCGHRNTILVDVVCSVVVMVSTRQHLPVRMLCSVAKPSTRLVALSTAPSLKMRLRERGPHFWSGLGVLPQGFRGRCQGPYSIVRRSCSETVAAAMG